MRRNIIAAAIVAASLVYSTILIAQPGGGFSKTAPISGTGSNGSPLKLDVCSSGSGYVSNGTSFACALLGDITGVTAGSGVHASSTTTSGAATIAIDPTYTQRRISTDCGAGSAVRSIAENGDPTCIATGGLSGGTTDYIPKWTSSTAQTSSIMSETGGQIAVNGSFYVASVAYIEALHGTVISPTALSANTDDWAPTSLADATIIRISLTGSYNLTGLTGGAAGRVIVLQNVDSTRTVTLVNDATSTAANRFYTGTGADLVMAGNSSAILVYDATSSRWRVVGAGGSSGDPDIPPDEVTISDVSTTIVATDRQPTLLVSLTDATTYTDWDPGIAIGQTTVIVSVSGEICGAARIRGIGDSVEDGQRIRVHNTCGTVTFEDSSDGNGTAAYRVLTPTGEDWDLLENDTADLFYDGDETRWRIVHEPDELIASSVSTSQLADNLDLSANGSTTVGDFRGHVQDSAATGTQNDFALDADAMIIRFTSTTATINGIAGGYDGRLIFLYNASTTTAIVHEAAGSTAANRIDATSGSNWTNSARALTPLMYDGTAARWRLLKENVFPSLLVTSTATFTGSMTQGDGDTDVQSLRMPKDSSTAPTLSSCGTSPSVTAGGSWAFTITAGTGGITACTATFASTKTATPICQARIQDVAEDVYVSAVSATAVTITAKTGTTDISSNRIDVICIGDS